MKVSEFSKDERIIKVFLDKNEKPIGEFTPPVKLTLDTTKIPDGPHTLKIVARSSKGVEGIKVIPFKVHNGPEIAVVGIKEDEVVDDFVSITINAYGSENQDQFIIRGSETPKAIPAWVWALIISVVGIAVFYLIMYWTPEFYESFF